ncbi:hypothetical protein Ciccas_003233 [Cichlidogyrus casuarinus]|uniref:Uncharacterized protein n=1 Tax=Cichlidogyrus casuarinus TaxID=1844966 RepID=A0ABD2QEY3_9PLAT
MFSAFLIYDYKPLDSEAKWRKRSFDNQASKAGFVDDKPISVSDIIKSPNSDLSKDVFLALEAKYDKTKYSEIKNTVNSSCRREKGSTDDSSAPSNKDGEEGEIVEEPDTAELSPGEDFSDEIDSDKELSSLELLTEVSHHDLRQIVDNILPVVSEFMSQKKDASLDPILVRKLAWTCLLCVCEAWSIFPSLSNKHCLTALELLDILDLLLGLNFNLQNENMVSAFQRCVKTFLSLEAKHAKTSKIRAAAFKVLVLYQLFILRLSRLIITRSDFSVKQELTFHISYITKVSLESSSSDAESPLLNIVELQRIYKNAKKDSRSSNLKQFDLLFKIRDNASIADQTLTRHLVEFGGSELQRCILLELVLHCYESNPGVIRWLEILLSKLLETPTAHVLPFDKRSLLFLTLLIARKQNRQSHFKDLSSYLQLTEKVTASLSDLTKLDDSNCITIELKNEPMFFVLLLCLIDTLALIPNSNSKQLFYFCIIAQSPFYCSMSREGGTPLRSSTNLPFHKTLLIESNFLEIGILSIRLCEIEM